MPISDQLKGFILALIVFSLFLYGYRYYRHTQDEPDFCSSCHAVQESFGEWQQSKHRDVLCQKCHEFGVMEQNRRLFSFVTTGKDPVSLSHGRVTPWEKCRGCHEDAVSQGSITPKKSFGHAKHVLEQRISCGVCHSALNHTLRPNYLACIACHQEREVHGIKIEQFSCLQCHRFSKREIVMTPRALCDSCHTGIPKDGPKAKLSCHYCHKPHNKEKPTSATCTSECHRAQANVGQHGRHLKQGIECMHCHKPHVWTVKQRSAKLCRECHEPRDPRSFKYIF